jgi:inner membrane protein
LEPITHVLYGATLARAGLNRVTPLATATVALAAEAPDVDFVVHFFADSVTTFAHHRGITHTLVGAPFVAAAVVAFIYGIQRLVERLGRGHPHGGPIWLRWARARSAPRWGMLYLFAILGCLSHILLDFTNGYGVRPLSPFLHRWWAWDTVFIIEPVLFIALAAGLLLPTLLALVQEEIGARPRGLRGRNAAIAALILVALVWGVRHHYHDLALQALWRQTYQGQEPIRVGAYPYPMNPFVWHGIVETENFFQTMNVDTRRGRVNPDGSAQIYFKRPETEVTEAAKRSRLGRIYFDWAVFPITEVQAVGPQQRAWEVRFFDLRFMYPGRERAPLGARALLGPDLQVLAEIIGTPTDEDAYMRALERIPDPDPTTD